MTEPPIAQTEKVLTPRTQALNPFKVTGVEWLLAVASLGVAGLALPATTHEVLRGVLLVLTLLGVALVIVAGLRALQTRTFGKVLILAGTLSYYWLEGVGAAGRSPAFSVPAGVPVFTPQYDLGVLKRTIVLVAAFQLLLLVGYSFRPRIAPLSSRFERRVDRHSAGASLWRYGLALAGLVPMLLGFGFDIRAAGDALVASRSATGDTGYQDVGLINLVSTFGLFAASLLLTEALLFRSLSRIQKLLVAAAVATPVLLGGVRHLWLFITLPVGAVALRRLRKRLRGRDVVRLVLVLAAALSVVQIQIALRGRDWSEITSVRLSDLTQTQVTGQFDAALFAHEIVPSRHGYFLEPAEPYFLIHWIPRRFWPDKPIMESWQFFNDTYIQGATTYNVTPSLVGQFHINFGLLGVLYAGFFMGFLAVTTDRVMMRLDPSSQRAVAVAVGFFYPFIFSSFRFYSPIYFTYVGYALIGAWILSRRRARGGMSKEPSVSSQPGGGRGVVVA